MKSTALLRRCLSIFLIVSPAPAGAQTDDFNDGNAAGWTPYRPLDAVGGSASLTVTGGAYVLVSDPSPNAAAYGPARCGSVRLDKSYGTFCVMVDISNWDPAEDTSMGILARLQPGIGIGATDGYAFTYHGKDNDVQISRIDNEAPTDLSGTPDITLSPGNSYRMVFFGIGTHLEGRIYDLNDLVNPLVTAVGMDATYSQGNCGLVVFASDNTRTSATFDNYNAGPGTPPPLTVNVAAGLTTVSWDTAAGLCHSLKASNDLLEWISVFGLTAAGGRTTFTETFNPLVPVRFFRLGMGP